MWLVSKYQKPRLTRGETNKNERPFAWNFNKCVKWWWCVGARSWYICPSRTSLSRLQRTHHHVYIKVKGHHVYNANQLHIYGANNLMIVLFKPESSVIEVCDVSFCFLSRRGVYIWQLFCMFRLCVFVFVLVLVVFVIQRKHSPRKKQFTTKSRTASCLHHISLNIITLSASPTPPRTVHHQ